MSHDSHHYNVNSQYHSQILRKSSGLLEILIYCKESIQGKVLRKILKVSDGYCTNMKD